MSTGGVMQESTTPDVRRAPPRWAQFFGCFVAAELVLNGVIVATVSVVGWDGLVRQNRVPIQIGALAIALIAALILAATRAVPRALASRLPSPAAEAARDARILAGVERLDQAVAATHDEIARSIQAQHEAEEARIATAANEASALTRLAALLQTVISAEQVTRQSAKLWRCHRTARGDLVCTLPLGRNDGIADGVQFAVIDTQAGRQVGRFRVTGTADTFAACTLVEGDGWLQSADRFTNAELPPHILKFALPDAARDLDAPTAERMLRLLSAVTATAPPPARPLTAATREVTR